MGQVIGAVDQFSSKITICYFVELLPLPHQVHPSGPYPIPYNPNTTSIRMLLFLH